MARSEAFLLGTSDHDVRCAAAGGVRWNWVGLAICVVSLVAGAQLPLRYDFQESQLAVFFMDIVPVGDTNGDGYADFAVTRPVYLATTTSNGAVTVYSGRDGAEIVTYLPPPGSNPVPLGFGSLVLGMGDVDGDGLADVAIGQVDFANLAANTFGELVVYSSGAAAPLYTIPNFFGASAITDNLGDVNGDGIGDVATVRAGAPQHLEVYSGADGVLLYQLSFNSEFRPMSLRAAGDVNGDGAGDIIVGDRYFPHIGFTTASTGAAAVLSGVDGALLHALQGPSTIPLGPSDFGIAVEGVGDLDADGFADFAVGAASFGLGKVLLYSGQTGAPLGAVTGLTSSDGFGRYVAGCGDLNGDGVPDFAASGPWWGDPSLGADGAGYGFVRAYSGADLSVIFEVFGTSPDRLGLGLAGLGDLNGDGFSEIGASLLTSSSVPGIAGVRVYSPGGVRRYGVGLGGAQTLVADWTPAPVGDPAMGTVACTGGVPGGAGFFGVSLGEANVSVEGVPVLIDPDPGQLFFTSPFVFDATGGFATAAPIRVPSVAGLLVRLQFFDLAAPFGSSNGLEFLLLP